MKMIMSGFVAITSIALLFLSGCEKQIILLPRDIINKKVEISNINGAEEVNISGLCGHSALGIDTIKHYEKDGALFVYILLKPGGNGDFDFTLPLSDNVNRIFIGDEMVWSKEP